MGAADPQRRTAVSRVLCGLSIAAAAIAVLVVVTGGFTTRMIGVRVSAHGAVRPTLLALLVASQASLSFLDRPPLAAHSRGVSIYGTGATPAGAAAEPIPETQGCQ